MEYEYEAHHEDELTLRLGDIIKNVRHIEEDGWMEGDLNGKRGLFPDNFVKVRRSRRPDSRSRSWSCHVDPIKHWVVTELTCAAAGG